MILPHPPPKKCKAAECSGQDQRFTIPALAATQQILGTFILFLTCKVRLIIICISQECSEVSKVNKSYVFKTVAGTLRTWPKVCALFSDMTQQVPPRQDVGTSVKESYIKGPLHSYLYQYIEPPVDQNYMSREPRTLGLFNCQQDTFHKVRGSVLRVCAFKEFPSPSANFSSHLFLKDSYKHKPSSLSSSVFPPSLRIAYLGFAHFPPYSALRAAPMTGPWPPGSQPPCK